MQVEGIMITWRLHFSFFLHVCVRVCVVCMWGVCVRGVCVCSCTCVHFYKGDCGCQRSMEGLVLNCSLSFEDKVSYWSGNSFTGLDWLGSMPQGFSCFCFLRPKIRGVYHHGSSFTWVLGIQTEILTLPTEPYFQPLFFFIENKYYCS